MLYFKIYNLIFVVSFFLILDNHNVECYKILGIFHTMAKSHAIVGEGLLKGLAEAGHDVTVLSAFPQKTPIKNYHDIEISGVFDLMSKKMTNLFDMHALSITEKISGVYDMGIGLTNHTLLHPTVKQFLADNRNTHFDVVIMEIFLSEAIFGIGHHFNAPVIGISTFGASKWTNDLVGTPSPPSYVPHPFLSFSDSMNIFQRFGNLLVGAFDTIYMDYIYMPKQVAIYNAAFPDPKPSLDELRRNTALVLLNNHFTLSYPRPYVPNMIEVGGMHIRPKRNPLPENLKSFIESSKNGCIYFSLGSNLQSAHLPAEKRDAILRAFSKLNLNVLWKWEDENLPGKPNNVFISKWFPQDDILAHPNIKLFITHGGLLSTTEATYYGVPVIGIPIFGDQQLNMERTKRAGYGLVVPYNELNEEKLSNAINEILSSPKFVENAKVVSMRYHDQPMKPLEMAVYWVEYVCRHKGAKHLHSAGQNLNSIQYHNLDIFALIILFIILFDYILYRIFRAIFCKHKKSIPPPQSKNNKKVKKN